MTDLPRDDEPRSEGLGEEAGPDFAPPGAGTSYPTTPSPVASPPAASETIDPTPPSGGFAPPTGPPRALGYASPPPRPGVQFSRRMIITLVSVVAAVMIIIGTITVAGVTLNKPTAGTDPWSTAPRDKKKPLPTKPEQQNGPGFTFTSPAGWTRAPDWGDGNDAKIIDAAGNDITVYIFAASNPKKRCDAELKSLEIWVPGVITDLPDRQVDGQVAPGGQLAGEETYRMRCAVSKGSLFNLTMQSHNDEVEDVDAAFNAVLDSWQWT